MIKILANESLTTKDFRIIIIYIQKILSRYNKKIMSLCREYAPIYASCTKVINIEIMNRT